MKPTSRNTLTCTANTLCHVDYGIPISWYKSTDYRTSTGTYHRFVPPLPADFIGVRAKPNLTKRALRPTVDADLKQETYRTTYDDQYYVKQGDRSLGGYLPKPVDHAHVNYVRNVQEKLFSAPPPPRDFFATTAKSDYCGAEAARPAEREVFPPNPNAFCPIRALGRDECPGFPPEQPGYYRLMDPYMTTARLSYVPFTLSQQDGIARKDIVTFYDASNIPRAGKGYGPRNGPAIDPIFKAPNYEMYDKMVFKNKYKGKTVSRMLTRQLPHTGKQSEYRSSYTTHTYFDSYPLIGASLEDWDTTFPGTSLWQALAPPGMYCTESCHVGKLNPIRAVVESAKPSAVKPHDSRMCHERDSADGDVIVCCVDEPAAQRSY